MFKTLVLTRFSSMFFRKPKDGKKQKGNTNIYFGLIIFLILDFGFLFFSNYIVISDQFCNGTTGDGTYFALAAFLSMMLAFIGSVMTTQQQIYEAKDNELLLSMPIKPSMILSARIVVLYVWAFAFSAINFVPALIVYAGKYALSLSGWIMAVLCLILVPLISMTVSFIIAWLIQLITSRMKNKTLFNIVLTLALMIPYMAFCMKMYNIVSFVAQRKDDVESVFKKYLYPFYACGMAVSDFNIVNFLIFLAVTIIPFAIAMTVISKTFIKIATRKKGFAKTKYVEKRLKVRSARMAVAMKEVRHFTSNSTYAVNGGMGLIMQVAAAIYAVVKFNTLAEALNSTLGMSADYATAVVIVGIASVGTIVEVTVCAISLEGKNLWILKSSPLSAIDVLKGKLYAHYIIALPFAIVSGIIINFIPGISLVNRFFAIVVPVVLQIFVAYFGLACNLCFPKLDWQNEAQAIKQSTAAFIAVFGGMGMVIFLVGISIALYLVLPYSILLIIITAIFGLGSFLYELYLHGKGSRRYQEL